MGILEAGLGVLEAGLGVLEAGLSVLEARLGVLEAGLGVMVARLAVLEARLVSKDCCHHAFHVRPIHWFRKTGFERLVSKDWFRKTVSKMVCAVWKDGYRNGLHPNYVDSGGHALGMIV